MNEPETNDMKYLSFRCLSSLLAAWVWLACAGCGGDKAPFDDDPPQEEQPQKPAAGRAAWPELPLLAENANYQYVTHFCKVGNVDRARNYTLCFDKTRRASWWVAYPLHNAYLGSGRPDPDPWAYDPAIAESAQANLVDRSYTGSYDRGHQIPNADRNADQTPGGMCYQTFYASNATPQAHDLNAGSWADLETKVRTWARGCADTLYVVTGAWWAPQSTKATTDRSGNRCPVPDAYFKVVARTVAGNIRTAGDLLGDYPADKLKTIGFWVENSDSRAGDNPRSWAVSVAEIESRTGFTFFPTLPEAVKQQNNSSAWGW